MQNKKYYFVVLSCSVHPASCWMHWATRWRHSVLSAASSLASSHVMSMFFRLRFTMSVQFIFDRPGFLLYPFNSHRAAWWGILESSIRMTCPNHLVFVLWLCLRVSSSPFSFWCHHFSLCPSWNFQQSALELMMCCLYSFYLCDRQWP